MLGVLLLVAVITFSYCLLIKPYSYWSKKNVKTGQVTPFFGDSLRIIIGKESFPAMVQRIYNLEDVRYIGTYQFQIPLLIVKSPELIRQMCVKDFDHFLDHRRMIDDNVEEIWSRNLVGLRGEKWKNAKSTLTSSFTSSKMRSMFDLICHNANLLVQYSLKKNEEILQIDAKDIWTRYVNDAIASSVFGIQLNSFEDRKNEFYILGKESSNLNTIRIRLILFMYQVFPNIAKFCQMKVFRKRTEDFFINFIKDRINMRSKQNIKRPDILEFLLEARRKPPKYSYGAEMKDPSFAPLEDNLETKNINQNLTDIDIASHMFSFFNAGYENISAALCFMAYELAINSDIQKKLIKEIDSAISQSKIWSYEIVMSMTYLDMVVTETLRKWPITPATDRLVSKSYTIQPISSKEKPVHLDIDDNILIPIFALHRDPKYYEDPEKFDPDRFSPKNKKKINPFVYLPFGVGPRGCIGSRFAILQIKVAFCYLLTHFVIVTVEKTQIPLNISRMSHSLMPEGGFFLGLKKRR